MAFNRKIVRDEEFKIRMSKEEKELFFKFAEQMERKPSALARSLIMGQAEAEIENAVILPLIKAYKAYLKVTGQNEEIKRIENEE